MSAKKIHPGILTDLFSTFLWTGTLLFLLIAAQTQTVSVYLPHLIWLIIYMQLVVLTRLRAAILPADNEQKDIFNQFYLVRWHWIRFSFAIFAGAFIILQNTPHTLPEIFILTCIAIAGFAGYFGITRYTYFLQSFSIAEKSEKLNVKIDFIQSSHKSVVFSLLLLFIVFIIVFILLYHSLRA